MRQDRLKKHTENLKQLTQKVSLTGLSACSATNIETLMLFFLVCEILYTRQYCTQDEHDVPARGKSRCRHFDEDTESS